MKESGTSPGIIRFGVFEADLRSGELRKQGIRIKLQEQPFQILILLLTAAGDVVTREALREKLWPADTFVDFDHSLGTAIKKLREALGDSAENPRFVETLPRRGYRFIAQVDGLGALAQPTAAPQMPADGVSRRIVSQPAETIPGAHGTRKRWRGAAAKLLKPALVLGGVALLAAILYLVARPFIGSRSTGAPQSSEATQVTSSAGMDIFPSFSPDGSAIAYSSDISGSFEIYLKQLTIGGRIIQLTNDGAGNSQPAWSPDGRTIAYYSQAKGGIWLMPALGGVARQLTSFGSSPAWSPDGNEIVFQSGGWRGISAWSSVSVADSTLWIVSVRDGIARQITQPGKPAGGHNSPSWSPDGKEIVFVSADFSDTDALWTVAATGNDLKSIGCCGPIFNPVYSRDGTSLYVGAVFGNADIGIWKISVANPPKSLEPGMKIFSSPSAPSRFLAISSDGRKLAYSSALTVSNLYSVPISPPSNEATGPPVALTRDTRYRKTSPAFSRDGRRIAFDVYTSDPEGGVWVMDADGGNSSLVSDQCAAPQWLPDGKNIDCLGGDGSELGLWRHNLESGRHEKLRGLPDDANFLGVTRDGKLAAFTSQRSGTPNVWVAPVAGGELRQITFDPESMGYSCWSPDGKFLALDMKRGDSTYLMMVPAGGGDPVQLTFEPGQSWAHDWSPDGDKIVFAGLRNGIWNVWWVSRSTKIEKQVTQYRRQNVYVRYPAWSPAGNQIVYEYGETTANIWMLDLK